MEKRLKPINFYFILQVRRKITEIQSDGSNVNIEHEDPIVFSDQQLLQWMNRLGFYIFFFNLFIVFIITFDISVTLKIGRRVGQL